MARSRADTRSNAARRDVCGLLLALAVAGWEIVASAGHRGDPYRVVELLAASVAVFAAARLAVRCVPWLPPAALVTAVIVTMAMAPDALNGGPLDGPLRYGNANGALYVQGCGAAFVLLYTRTWILVRGAAAAAGIWLAAAAWLTRSAAAGAAALVVTAVALIPPLARGGRFMVPTCVAAFGLALAGSTALGAAYPFAEGSAVGRAVAHTLSVRRPALWHDALSITERHPARGVGPEQFGRVSPVARKDRDARWAHSEFLQQSAETGVVGGLLAVSLVVWGFCVLARAPNAIGVIGALTFLGLAGQSCIDYVLHFWPVALSGAAVLGMATARVRTGHHEVIAHTSMPAAGSAGG